MSAEDILRIDLQGVQVLVPHIVKALEITLPVPDKELILGYENLIVSFLEIGRNHELFESSFYAYPTYEMNLIILYGNGVQGLYQPKVSALFV